MQIVNFPQSFPCLFWTLAIGWSSFQAYAGFQYGLYIYDSSKPNDQSIKKLVRNVAYGLHHGLFYFTCSLSGFLAWGLTHLVSSKINNWSNISGGTGAILVAIAVFSVVGVSGALPRILYLGKKPV